MIHPFNSKGCCSVYKTDLTVQIVVCTKFWLNFSNCNVCKTDLTVQKRIIFFTLSLIDISLSHHKQGTEERLDMIESLYYDCYYNLISEAKRRAVEIPQIYRETN